MASRDVPEVAKWFPGVPEWRHQAPQMETPRSQKGPVAESVALKIGMFQTELAPAEQVDSLGNLSMRSWSTDEFMFEYSSKGLWQGS